MGMLNLKSFEDFLYESTVKKIKIENQEKFYNLIINRTSLSEENDKGLNCLVINDKNIAETLQKEGCNVLYIHMNEPKDENSFISS